MLNSDYILKAMNGIHEEQVVLAGDLLGYTEGAQHRRGHGGVWRIALIAAIIAVLFSMTAYALDWFGLQSRLTIGPEAASLVEEYGRPEEVGYLSMNSYGDTPAAQAHMEWTQFYWDYTASKRAEAEAAGLDVYDWDANAWEPEDEELRNISDIYGAYDKTMFDKLMEIRDKYDVRMHTMIWTPPTDEDFFRITGAEPFTHEKPNHSVCEYIYDDGSFKFSAGGDWYNFTLIRGTLGALDPSLNTVQPEDYEEWQYTTSSGNLIDIAWSGYDDGSGGGFMFYQEGDYLVTVFFGVGDGENVEKLAELIDFSAACKGDWEKAQAAMKEAMESNTRLPETAVVVNDDLTLEAFLQTPECMALNEFYQLYAEHVGIQYDMTGFMGVYGHPYGAHTQEEGEKVIALHLEHGLFPPGTGNESTNEDILAVCEKYALSYPTYKEFIVGHEAVPYGYNGGYGNSSPTRGITEEEVLQKLGYDSVDSLPVHDMQQAMIDWYDNGAYQANDLIENQVYYCINYIPKGTLYTCIVSLGSAADYADVRIVETACGAKVCLATGNPDPYRSDMILYESPNAYIIVQSEQWKALLDLIDFTRFK